MNSNTVFTQGISTGSEPNVHQAVGIGQQILEIPLDRIVDNHLRPRKIFNNASLQELADSIKANGLIHPIIVTDWLDNYRVIVGERRVKAARMAGLKTISALVRNLNDQAVLEMALVENLQREDLNPIEEAQAFYFLVDELNLSHQDLAKRVGKSRPYVSNSLRLLELPETIKNDLVAGILTAGHARAVLSLESEKDQEAAWQYIKEEDLSVRKSEEYVNSLKEGQAGAVNSPKKRESAADQNRLSPEWEDILAKLSVGFGADVRLSSRAHGKGRLEFCYDSQEDLERIVDIFLSVVGA